jgi:hypothetical protein
MAVSLCFSDLNVSVVVLDVGAGLELAVIPMGGEFVNMTHFVTD